VNARIAIHCADSKSDAALIRQTERPRSRYPWHATCSCRQDFERA